MSEITAERRMELIRTIREENSRNRMNLKNRENILYGQTYDKSAMTEAENMTDTSPKSVSLLGIRILVSVILFSLFVILDYTEDTWFSVNATSICESIKENASLNSFAFIKEITYTLTHE